ncbi:hypothetical protein [Streptomyces nodosus]|uniref:hypothetical protein n=1 Tax=Streptomyces nodosus TaxID=40318 RepID=UPI003823408A
MIRRPVAWTVAVVLLVEAVGIALLNWFLGVVVDRQEMSLAGLDPDMMSASSKAAGVVLGLYLVLCALAALLVAVRDRSPAGLWRVLLIGAAVVHGLLGALTVGLLGWPAFGYLMVVFGLIVLTLMTYDGSGGPADARPATGGPTPDEGTARGEGIPGAAERQAPAGRRSPLLRRPQLGDAHAQFAQQPADQRQ